MNRRHFLQAATVSALAVAIDPERLLWEPGKRVYVDLWTPPQVSIGDFVIFKTNRIWGRHRDHRDEWVFLRTGDIERVTRTASGCRIGVVTGIERGDAKIQTGGLCLNAYVLDNPHV